MPSEKPIGLDALAPPQSFTDTERLDWLIDQLRRRELRMILNEWTGAFVQRSNGPDRLPTCIAYAPRLGSFRDAIDSALRGEDAEVLIREEIKRRRSK